MAKIARLERGPEVGALLERLLDAQADGTVSTRAEAEDFVRRAVSRPST